MCVRRVCKSCVGEGGLRASVIGGVGRSALSEVKRGASRSTLWGGFQWGVVELRVLVCCVRGRV